MNTNPYSFGVNPYQQSLYNQMNQPNVLPQQSVIQVDGKASVDALRMSPNSSVLLMDKTAPIVWLCTSDGLGNVTSHAYDIIDHKETPPIEMETIDARVSELEKAIAEIKESMKNESDARTAKTNGNGKPQRAA